MILKTLEEIESVEITCLDYFRNLCREDRILCPCGFEELERERREKMMEEEYGGR